MAMFFVCCLASVEGAIILLRKGSEELGKRDRWCLAHSVTLNLSVKAKGYK